MKKKLTYTYSGEKAEEMICDADFFTGHGIGFTPDADGFPMYLVPDVAWFSPRYTVESGEADGRKTVTLTLTGDRKNTLLLWFVALAHCALFAVAVYNYFFDTMMAALFFYSAAVIAATVFYGTLTRRIAQTKIDDCMTECVSAKDAQADENA